MCQGLVKWKLLLAVEKFSFKLLFLVNIIKNINSDNILLYLPGCLVPEVRYTFNDTMLDDGRLPVNASITYECSDNRFFQSTCKSPADNNSSHGEWSENIVCPNMTGKPFVWKQKPRCCTVFCPYNSLHEHEQMWSNYIDNPSLVIAALSMILQCRVFTFPVMLRQQLNVNVWLSVHIKGYPLNLGEYSERWFWLSTSTSSSCVQVSISEIIARFG